MSSSWTTKKIESIKSRSVSDEFPDLLDEWFINGHMNINVNSNSICDLCSQNNLYYEYYIENNLNENIMLIGSSCINLFFAEVDEINTFTNGEFVKLNEKELKKHLMNLFVGKTIQIIDNEYESGFKTFTEWESSFYTNVKNKIINHEKLSPKQAHFFLEIAFDIIKVEELRKKIGRCISVDLNRKDYKEQMEIGKIINSKYIDYALSNEQKEKYRKK